MIKKVISISINTFLYLISKFIKKDESIWIFGAWMGNKYCDNSKYLFEYIDSHHKEIKCIWITSNPKVVASLKKENRCVYKKYSFMSIFWALRAKNIIFTHSNGSDIMPFINNRDVNLIQLWHGAPLKKIGLDDKLYTYKSKKKYLTNVKKKLFPFLIEDYRLICSSSDEDKKFFMTAFASENVKITGYARNDILSKSTAFPEINTNLKQEEFRIIYLPTFRDNIGAKIDLFSKFNFKFDEWNKFLKENNIYFKIKLHPVNKPSDKICNLLNSCDNIEVLDDEIDITEYLKSIDILITDYSSVYFDFLLMDRPIIFSPFDYADYLSKDRELYYEYNDVTPGPKCSDWCSIQNWIIKLKENPSLYEEEREKIKKRFHKYQDGKSCERIYNDIVSL